jgi:hypothetical protein
MPAVRCHAPPSFHIIAEGFIVFRLTARRVFMPFEPITSKDLVQFEEQALGDQGRMTLGVISPSWSSRERRVLAGYIARYFSNNRAILENSQTVFEAMVWIRCLVQKPATELNRLRPQLEQFLQDLQEFDFEPFPEVDDDE